jgi:poly(3-hydroxybutyrate) depolymerase
VLIACHGSGGQGSNTIRGFQQDGTLSKSFIIVAPDGSRISGKGRQWNQSVDVTFVGSTLLDHLESFKNVKPEFRIHGHSQGAALTNQILIENSDVRIVMAVTAASQLNAQQYHTGQFWPEGSSSGKTRLKKRSLLQIVGAKDTVIPAEGPPARGVAGFMVEWKESAYAYAKAMGYTKKEQTTPTDTTEYVYVDYGAVKAIEGKNWGHDAGARSGFSPTVVNFLMTGQLLQEIEESDMAETSLQTGFSVNDRVMTQWLRAEGGNDRWYSGRITSCRGANCSIRYDDHTTWTGPRQYIHRLPFHIPSNGMEGYRHIGHNCWNPCRRRPGATRCSYCGPMGWCRRSSWHQHRCERTPR